MAHAPLKFSALDGYLYNDVRMVATGAVDAGVINR